MKNTKAHVSAHASHILLMYLLIFLKKDKIRKKERMIIEPSGRLIFTKSKQKTTIQFLTKEFDFLDVLLVNKLLLAESDKSLTERNKLLPESDKLLPERNKLLPERISNVKY